MIRLLLLALLTTSAFASVPKLIYWYEIPQHIGDGERVSTIGKDLTEASAKKNTFHLDFTEKSEAFAKLGGWMVELDQVFGVFDLIPQSMMVNDSFFGTSTGIANLTYSDGKNEEVELNCHQTKKTLESKEVVRRVQCFIDGNNSFIFDTQI